MSLTCKHGGTWRVAPFYFESFLKSVLSGLQLSVQQLLQSQF